ncbi:hypothetical protein [Dubosiella muris]|mgnify:CR=1 FL=1|uniref:Uncharacterized protein n=3 Tax=Dubosiella TaxID=1937008 RepID=A0AC61R6B1_9FIRM|nr:hypothetical protein [Dubosiella muris]TGY65652.1 hypothetical protein E5336_07425 [Dubosiella muris]
MKSNENKSVKPQHLAAVALATAVTLPGMAILAEEVEQKPAEQDVVQQTENSEFVGITDTTFYEEESVDEEDPDINEFNESKEKESDGEDLFAGESVDYNIENQEKEELDDFQNQNVEDSNTDTFQNYSGEIVDQVKKENKKDQNEIPVTAEVKEEFIDETQFLELIAYQKENSTRDKTNNVIEENVISPKVAKEWNIKGSGTVEDPYQIATVDDLDFIRDHMSSHYILMNDIDLSHIDSFIPIGRQLANSKDEYFTGSFDGNHHDIYGVKINEQDPYKLDYGFFARTGVSASITNLNLNVLIDIQFNKELKNSSSLNIGGLIGYVKKPDDDTNYESILIIDNVTISGEIRVNFEEKKLYPHMYLVPDHYTQGGTASYNIGGLIGCGIIGYRNRADINNSNNNSNIYITGDFERLKNFDLHDRYIAIGGMIGENFDYDDNCKIRHSTNSGNITAQLLEEEPEIGGIVGRASKIIIDSCINKGNINVKTRFPNSYVGGVAGFSNYGNSINNTINVGDITINSPTMSIRHIGGVSGTSTKSQNVINAGNINILLPTNGQIDEWTRLSMGGVFGDGIPEEINNLYNMGNVILLNAKKDNLFPNPYAGRVVASADGYYYYRDPIEYNVFSLQNIDKLFNMEKLNTRDGVDLPLYDIYARVNKILLENGMPTLEELGRPIESFPGETEGPISSLDVSKTGREIEAGKIEILSGSYRNNQGDDVLEIAKNIKWISDNEEIAKIKNIMLGTVNKKESSVDFSLFIEGNKPGITMIHGIADDGQKVDFQVTIEPSISFSGSESRNVMWADEYNDHLFFPMNLDPSAKQLAVNCVMSFDGGSFSNDELREFIKSMDLTMERHHLASTSDHVFPTIGKATFKVDQKNRVTVVVPLTLDTNTLSDSAQMDMVLTIKTAAQKKQVRVFLNSVSSIDDGDGLPTSTEINGIKVSNNGKLIKTDPKTPDIFVQINWVKGVIGDTATQTTITKKILYDACDMVAKVFKEHGFNLHIDAGPESKDFVTGKLWSEYGSLAKELDYKPESFPLKDEALADILKDIYEDEENKIRMPIFRQCVLLDRFKDDKGTTGLAHLNGAIFSVAMHALGDLSNDDCVRWLAGTIMHELGHTLGLRHGGTDDVNYKPNYLSVMNYAYQADWQLRTKNAAGEVSFKDYLNYSEYELPEMNKDLLNERDAQNTYFGMIPKKLKMIIKYKYNKDGMRNFWLWDENDRNIDWNRDGIISDSPIKGNIYTSENIKVIPQSTNDWNQIKILNSAVGGFGMTLEEYLESVRKLSVVDEEELLKYIEPDQPIKPKPPVDDPNEKPDTPSNPSEKPDKPVDNNKPGEKPDKPTDNNKPSNPEKPSENKPMTPAEEANKPVVTPISKEDTSTNGETVNLTKRNVFKIDSVSTTRSPETGFAVKKSNSLFAGLMSVVGLGWIANKKRKEKR